MSEETAVAAVIRRHYGLKRRVTVDEVAAEVNNLRRRHRDGLGWDDSQHRLAAKLALAGVDCGI